MSANANNVALNVAIYNALVGMATNASKTAAEVEKAREKHKGAYDSAADAVALSFQAANWDREEAQRIFWAEWTKLEDNIKHNRDNLAVKTRAEKRQKPDKKTGARYTVPSSVMSAKSVIKAAFNLGSTVYETNKAGEPVMVPVLDEKGKETAEKRVKARSFTAIREENQVIREANEMAKMEQATGPDKLRYDLRAMLGKVIEALPQMTEETMQSLQSAIGAALLPATPAEEKPAETVGETLAETAAEEKPAEAAKPRKSRGNGRRQAA